MAARGRGYNQDWDPMRDDYDNSTYDRQYPDDSSNCLVNLDHCRLYITNIPKALSSEGIHTVFSKYGTLTEAFISSNPEKRYGLVSFETPGEAKLAMMKLNRTEPLGLVISIAHKARNHKDSRDRVSGGQRDRDNRSYREDTGSVGSRSNMRKQEGLANGDNMEDLIDDDVAGLDNSLDPDTNLELESLRLEHLKLQEAQVLCKHRMLLLRQAEKKSSATSRCILPNGRIVVRNVDKSEAGRDGDASFGAGAGDSLKIPALQRVANCVACGGGASLFCGGCGVTPYCSAGCQRRDYAGRHQKVCHNLKRSVGGTTAASKPELLPTEDVALLPAALPLRRPRSPDSAKRERRSDDSGSDRAAPNPNHKFGPPGTVGASNHKHPRPGPPRAGQAADDQPRHRGNQERNDRQNNDDARSGRGNDRFDNRRQNRDDGERPNRQHQNRDDGERLSRPGGMNNRSGGGDRKFDNRRPNPPKGDEEWGAKPAAKPEPKPESKPEPLLPTPKPKSPAVQLMEPKLQNKTAAKEDVKTATPATPDVVNSARPLVPKDSIVDLLSVGDTFTLAVGAAASDCRAGAGLVCLALTERHTEQYMQLLDEQFARRCRAGSPARPQPGDTFVYLNSEDGGWYRARCLNEGLAALLDAHRLVPLEAGAECRALPDDAAAAPEYCCRLAADCAQIGDNFSCTVVSKSGAALNVALVNIETGAPQGSGTVQRWLPAVDYPAPEPAAKTPTAAPAAIPSVPRPPLADKSRVILVDATEPGRVFLRSADTDQQKEFDDVVMEVAVYGMTAVPLKESPVMGQTVVAKFTDGVHYRALCRRVNSKLNKYLLEYIEYGNTAVAFLEDLYPCPPALQLDARPALASQAELLMTQKAFTPAATDYLDRLKNEPAELILTIPSGAASAPSGSAVRLAVAASGEDVNRAVDALCTPEWRKLLERGGDVLDVRAPVFADVTYVDLPEAGCELTVLDAATLAEGVVNGHERGAPHAARARALADQLAEYCNSALCKDPYLPKPEEVCVALCPKTNQWVRATLMQQAAGAGGADADVLLFDRGEVARLPVARLRKIMPEFVAHLPAACCSIEIQDFPKQPTEEQLALARRYMRIDARGEGSLRVTRARKDAEGEWTVEAPELIQAMMV